MIKTKTTASEAREARFQNVQAMIIKLRTYLLTSEPIVSLTDDSGQSITYDRKGAIEMLKEYEAEERRFLKPRRLVSGVDLREAYG